MHAIQKAREIFDLHPSFVSLVAKPANRRSFLAAKAEDGTVQITTQGKVVCAVQAEHYITGIVYEPYTEDAHGEYMTADEIRKAAYWFAKNGNRVDLQHNCVGLCDACVVENWVTKSDSEISDPVFGVTSVKRGTWLLTVEVIDETVWRAITSGEIAGFSLFGIGRYGEERNLPAQTDPPAVAQKQEMGEAGFFREFCAVVKEFLAGLKPKKPESEETEMTEEQFKKCVADELSRQLPKAVADAVAVAAKALIPAHTEPEPVPEATPTETLTEAVCKAVQDTLTPMLQAAGLPTALDTVIEKSDDLHYLHGIL